MVYARGFEFKTFRQDTTTHAADRNLGLVNLGRREARPAQRDEDEQAACCIAVAMQSAYNRPIAHPDGCAFAAAVP